MKRCSVMLFFVYLLAVGASVGKASASPITRHDRNVIRFFHNHPGLAKTPSGGLALSKVLPRVVRALTSATRATVIPATNDWMTAVRIVQRPYPGSESWLLNCSSSEGGHGIFVMNYQGSGAGGWMQYMEGTFWGDFHAAIIDLRSRGYTIPGSAWNWSSPLGQALAAGWAYYHSRPSGKWTGGSC